MPPAKTNYTALDQPEVLAFLFHPRAASADQAAPDSARDELIPVADDVTVGGRFHMGRSLGSASALELAWQYPDQMDALVIESGFAYAGPLLQHLGINLAAVGCEEALGFGHTDKIKTFKKPTLIIYAEYDHIIPFSDGQALFDACVSPDKSFLKIPGANHNDIFMRGLAEYLAAVKRLVESLQ